MHSSIAAGSVLAPRVSQVEQILTVVKKIPFLLGMFIPLNLAKCVYLQNRSGSFFDRASAASCRGFDCVQLRSNGERAVEYTRVSDYVCTSLSCHHTYVVSVR